MNLYDIKSAGIKNIEKRVEAVVDQLEKICLDDDSDVITSFIAMTQFIASTYETMPEVKEIRQILDKAYDQLTERVDKARLKKKAEVEDDQ